MRVLVTGGCGYIGKNIVHQLLKKGHEVTVVDDLSNCRMAAAQTLYNMEHAPRLILKRYQDYDLAECAPHAVVHLADHKNVLESEQDPGKYMQQNVYDFQGLVRKAGQIGVETFVYSSSASVYGAAPSPVHEEMPLVPLSVYGTTKMLGESFLKSFSHFSPMKIRAARYFNVVGAGCSGLLGDSGRDRSSTLFGRCIAAHYDKKKVLQIRGRKHETTDGTAVRDFIHVEDLAAAHCLMADDHVASPYEVVNIGTGHGHTVLEVVRMFERLGMSVPHEFVDADPTEVSVSYAWTDKIKELYKWQPRWGLQDMVQSAISWSQGRLL